mmetsp:Transcript_13773/g.33905  ORF Transcript_13773/g.33905 Transcript_13773/m.33905 type:complete len:146 (-) Transcript_13773:193-630(-)
MGIVGSACCQSQPCLVDQGELVLTNHAMAFHTEQSMDSFRSVVDDSEEENHSGLTSARGWPNYYRDTYNKLFRRRRSGRSRAGGGSAGSGGGPGFNSSGSTDIGVSPLAVRSTEGEIMWERLQRKFFARQRFQRSVERDDRIFYC